MSGEKPKDIMKHALNFLMWEDVKQTIFVMITTNLLFVLVQSFHYSFIYIITYFSFYFLILGIFLNGLCHVLGVYDDGKPDNPNDDYEFISSETVRDVIYILYMTVCSISRQFKEIVQLKNAWTTLRVFGVLFFLSFAGLFFDDVELAWIGFNLAFLIPLIYISQKDTIHKGILRPKDLFLGHMKKILDKIPRDVHHEEKED